jgi:hypothetical protein
VAVSVCRQRIELAEAAKGAITADVFPGLLGPSDDGHLALPRLSTGQRPHAFLMIKLDAEIADLSSRAATRHLESLSTGIRVGALQGPKLPASAAAVNALWKVTPCPTGIRLDLDRDRAKRNVRFRNVSQRNRTDHRRAPCHRRPSGPYCSCLARGPACCWARRKHRPTTMGCVGCGLGIESRFAFCPKYGAGLNGAVAHVGAVVGTRPLSARRRLN